MNEALCAPHSDKEISNALFQIGPLKAPSTDGFPTHFYQRNWEVQKKEIVDVVLEFFVSGVMRGAVNDVAVVLISKVPRTKELKEFRPISLCNVIYKIVSKCLVNRLWPLLTDLISENQSAFILGRLICDNSIIAFECIHHIQAVSGDAPALCPYKLDLSKAYDRVDWDFFGEGLARMGLFSGMDFSYHGLCYLNEIFSES